MPSVTPSLVDVPLISASTDVFDQLDVSDEVRDRPLCDPPADESEDPLDAIIMSGVTIQPVVGTIIAVDDDNPSAAMELLDSLSDSLSLSLSE